MRQKILAGIAAIDVLGRVDVRTIGDREYSEYVAALEALRALLIDMLRTIDTAEAN